VSPGGEAKVSLIAEPPAEGLAGWQINVVYDAALVTPFACSPDPEGSCDINFAPNEVATSGQPEETLTDAFLVADISFNAVGAAGTCSPLQVEVKSFLSGSEGNPESSPIVSNGQICIQGTPVPTAPPTPEPTPVDPPCPRFADFNPANFSNPTNIDNPLLPLIPGRQLTLDGVAQGAPRRVVYTATDVTKVINGVETLVVWDTDYSDGVLAEEKIAFFAQDDAGNVWNLGEYPEVYLDGVFVGAPNTWIAGNAHAEGGVQMPAEPVLNQPAFLQGWAPSIHLLDCARVIAIDGSVCVPAACYENILITNETSPLDPDAGSEQKHHAPGIGSVNITAGDVPPGEAIALISRSELSPEDMAAARKRTLELDARAYGISAAYADTEPADAPDEPDPTPDPSPTPEASPAPTTGATPTPVDPPCSSLVEFNAANFTNPTTIDHEFFPLIPGRQLVLEGVSGGSPRRVSFTATDMTKVINGVRTLVIWDRDYRDGVLTQEALAFFAQDNDGNVWKLGQYPEVLDENGELLGAPDTWIAGSAEAEGGVHMPAQPALSLPPYLQGRAPGIDFLYCAEIFAVDQESCVPADCFDDVLITDETSPLVPEDGSQRKFHAPGVGIVEVKAMKDPQGEKLALTNESELGQGDLAAARARVFALDNRAYETVQTYGETAPVEGPLVVPTSTPAPTVALSGSTPAPTKKIAPAAAEVEPTRTPLPLAARRAARLAVLRSARFLPTAGGADSISAGPISIGWMVPMGMGFVLLGAYVYGTVRRNALVPVPAEAQGSVASRPAAPETRRELNAIDLMFERLENLKRERREADLRDAHGGLPERPETRDD
jgi:hypothetical protein